MNLKEKIKNGKSICGTLVNIPAISIVEMMGYFDYDYLWIDLEHSAITFDMCYEMLVAQNLLINKQLCAFRKTTLHIQKSA